MSDTVHPTQRITGTVSIGGGGGGRKEILSNTTAGWESDPYLISVKDTIYVYTDYKTDHGQSVPAMKIGDGSTRLSELPFSTCPMESLPELGALASKDTASGTIIPTGSCTGTDIALETTTVTSMTSAGTLPVLAVTMDGDAMVIDFSTGSLPTVSNPTTVATGTVTSITDPTFAGNEATIEVS